LHLRILIQYQVLQIFCYSHEVYKLKLMTITFDNNITSTSVYQTNSFNYTPPFSTTNATGFQIHPIIFHTTFCPKNQLFLYMNILHLTNIIHVHKKRDSYLQYLGGGHVSIKM